MNSMTGYGKGFAENDGNSVCIEISSVNGKKQTEIHSSLPRELSSLDASLRQIILQTLSRGNLQFSLNYQLNPSMRKKMTGIDIETARQMADALKRLAQETGLPPPKLQDVLEMPGVLQDANTELPTLLSPLAEQAMNSALKDLSNFRAREGEALKQDLKHRGELIRGWLETIDNRRDEALSLQRQRLRERIDNLAPDIKIDEEHLSRELVFYVERADITEEVVRLKTHLVHYFELLESLEPAGRNLDFLGQEMNREITTLSSKTADMPISETALAMKVEISKIREQVMNIE